MCSAQFGISIERANSSDKPYDTMQPTVAVVEPMHLYKLGIDISPVYPAGRRCFSYKKVGIRVDANVWGVSSHSPIEAVDDCNWHNPSAGGKFGGRFCPR